MEEIKKKIESYGLTLVNSTGKFVRIKHGGLIIVLNMFDLLSMTEDDMMLHIKQRFYSYNIKVDLNNPEKNKTTTDFKSTPSKTLEEKKENIREILKSRKLIS